MDKHLLKSKLKIPVLQHDPELIIKDAQWEKAYNYYRGYKDCFSSIVKFMDADDPFAHNFILEETLKHLIKICR